MKRIMVNLDNTVGKMVERKANEQKRSTSSYVAILIENDLRAAGMLPDDSRTQAEDRALLKEADAAGIAWRPLLKRKLAQA
jgi:hypothetical protein